MKRPVTVLICLTFFLLGSPLYAQAESVANSRIFTLDETLNILYPAGSNERKEFRWDPFFREGSITVGGHYGAFSTALATGESGFLMVDNRDVYPVSLPYTDSGELVFPEQFVNTARDAFSRSINEDSSHYRIAAIIIDPGHGGREPGAVSTHTINGKKTTIMEKDIVLKASKLLQEQLVKTYPDKRILMTRESDITCSLEERTVIANSVPIRKNEAIIYISIHANSSRDKNAKGFEVWHLKSDYRRTVLDESHFPDSPELHKIMNLLTEEAFITESIRIAESILDSLKTAMGKSMPSRGLKEEDWFVVRRSRMPAVLVELGFVSNKDDVVLMTTDAHLNKMVDAVYKGITDFVGAFERSGGFIASR
ncbi:MAG: N-acetylmuramoyl-L-alanine amidase [Treponema sp.]|nr:N-acetylmuramoyl-L-alanine amidase [Treponema sp.]